MYTSLRTYLQTCAPYKVFKKYTDSPYKAFINIPLDGSRLGEFAIRWKLTKPIELTKEKFHQTCIGIDTDILANDDVLSIKFRTFLPRDIIDKFVDDMSYANIFSEKYLSNLSMKDVKRELIICLAMNDSYHTIKFYMNKDTNISHNNIISIFPEAETKDQNYYTCNIVDNDTDKKYRFSILQNQRFVNLRHYEEGFHGIRSIGSKEGRNNTAVHT